MTIPKKFLLCATALPVLCLLTPSAVQAQVSRIYFAGYLGLSGSNDQEFTDSRTNTAGDIELDSTPSFAGALGFRLSKQLRVEAELSYKKPDINSLHLATGTTYDVAGELNTWLGLMNVYYDFDVPWKVTPYVSAGLGMGYIDGELNSSAGGQTFSDSAYGLAWQAGAGIKYRPRTNLAYTLGYRYEGTQDLELGDIDLGYSGHEFRIGLEYDLDWQ